MGRSSVTTQSTKGAGMPKGVLVSMYMMKTTSWKIVSLGISENAKPTSAESLHQLRKEMDGVRSNKKYIQDGAGAPSGNARALFLKHLLER